MEITGETAFQTSGTVSAKVLKPEPVCLVSLKKNAYSELSGKIFGSEGRKMMVGMGMQ